MDPKEEVRHRLSVEEVVGEYLELKPAGGASLRALCPFHGEKTPSFYVSKEKQIWHCFGCDKGGDIFAFVMEMEGIEFPEALRLLAKKAGVEIPRYDSTQSNERSRLLKANELARRFFEKVYTDSASSEFVRAYVTGRGIPEQVREEFGLGYAPDGWDTLVKCLSKRGFSDAEILSAGLGLQRKSGSGLLDRFRERLMIPLQDAHGNTIGFTGRVLPPDERLPVSGLGSRVPDHGPKYMNSPETPIYRKGEMLYGLSKAKQAMREEKFVIIVEGNLDVIASHKASVRHVVGSSGTALTESQIRLLQRYVQKLMFCFDADAAGFHAALRGIHLATELGCDVSVILIPEGAGKDPDEVVQKDPELWRRSVSTPIPIMEYYVTHATQGKDMESVDVKREVGHFLLSEIGRLPDAIEREHWLSRLADLLRIDVSILRTMMTAPGSKPTLVQSPTLASKSFEPLSRAVKTFQAVFSAFLQFPDERAFIIQRLDDAVIPDHPLGNLYRSARLLYTGAEKDRGTKQSFFSGLSALLAHDESAQRLLHASALLGERLASDISETDRRSYLEEHFRVLTDERRKARRQFLQRELHAAEARGDKEAVQTLLKEFQSIH